MSESIQQALAVSARTESGLASPFVLNDKRELKTSQTKIQHPLKENVTLNPYESHVISDISGEGFTKGTLHLTASNGSKIEVFIRYSNHNGLFTEGRELIYSSDGETRAHTISYPLNATRYQLTIRNAGGTFYPDGNPITDIVLFSNSIIDLSNGDNLMGEMREIKNIIADTNRLVKETNQTKTQEPLKENVRLNSGESHVINEISGEGFAKGTLHLTASNHSIIEVFIRYSNQNGLFEQGRELIYRSSGESRMHTISFPLNATRYQLTIRNVGGNFYPDGGTITEVLLFSNSVIVLSNQDDLTSEIREIQDEIENTNRLMQKDDQTLLKQPTTHLKWKKLDKQITHLTKAYDDRYYTLDNNQTFKVYADLFSEPVETGVTISTDKIQITKLIVMESGITVLGNVDLIKEVVIYHTPDINTEPTLVFQSDTTSNSIFSARFGIDSFSDGLNQLILAGVYGTGQGKKPLLLSTDGGQSFTVVKETQDLDKTGDFNSHWHDVAIDHYHGYLWATEGDGPINQKIWYSQDLGGWWQSLPNKTQPTGIGVFADRISLGRDDGVAGLDEIRKTTTYDEKMEFKKLRDIYYGGAFSYYANKPLVEGREGYMDFHLYLESKRPIVVGTGDGGKSWHGLGFGNKNINSLLAMDENYIYARDENDDYPLFSERIKWQ